MKRQGMILFMVALLALPIFATALTSCGTKEVKQQVVVTDEEKARLEAERLRQEQYAAAKGQFENDMVYFDFDRYNIRPDAAAVLGDKAAFMSNYPNVVAEIQGHCDERGTEAYNMALGDRRAFSSKKFMEDRGIASSRMTTISYGEERPLDPGHNEAAWSLNRRAQFVLTAE
jgi:peptidoglycan-associated lipoprotein